MGDHIVLTQVLSQCVPSATPLNKRPVASEGPANPASTFTSPHSQQPVLAILKNFSGQKSLLKLAEICLPSVSTTGGKEPYKAEIALNSK